MSAEVITQTPADELKRLEAQLLLIQAGNDAGVSREDMIAIIKIQQQFNVEVMKSNVSLVQELENRDKELIEIMLTCMPVMKLMGVDFAEDKNTGAKSEKDLDNAIIDQIIKMGWKIFTEGRSMLREFKKLESLNVYFEIFHHRYAERLQTAISEQRIQKALNAHDDDDE